MQFARANLMTVAVSLRDLRMSAQGLAQGRNAVPVFRFRPRNVLERPSYFLQAQTLESEFVPLGPA